MKRLLAVIGMTMSALLLSGCSSAPTMDELLSKLECDDSWKEEPLGNEEEVAFCDLGNDVQVVVWTYENGEQLDRDLKQREADGGPTSLCTKGDAWLACTHIGTKEHLAPLGGEDPFYA